MATEELVVPPPTDQDPLHQPWRLFVALGELVAAAVAVYFAFDVWPLGIAKVVEHYPNDITLESTRWVGSWMALAILLGTVGALFVLDALRQTGLAVRARPKRGK